MKRLFVVMLAAAWTLACSQESAGPRFSTRPDAGPPPCEGEQALCLDHDSVRLCEEGHWVEFDCPSGSGCLQGHCELAACSDECRLGERDGNRSCELFDMSTGEWAEVDPAGSLHDRARDYTKWLHRDAMAFGGVGSAAYEDPGTYEKVKLLDGLGDSAIWTGTYLAAEALRLQATGAADARANVISTVETLNLWFNVSGHPGLLARYAVPSGQKHPTLLRDMNCEFEGRHCNVSYKGKRYDYIGEISRDQYQGVLLGYALAYEALGPNDEDTRKLIREDVVEFVQELMKLRSVPVVVTINGIVNDPFNVDLQFVVLDKAENKDGKIHIDINTDDAIEGSGISGYQEFIPDLSLITDQSPLTDWLPMIPRPGSGIMLASFFQVGMLVTDGIRGYEDEHRKFLDFYENNDSPGGSIDDWLDIAEIWSYLGECGGGYYANNIAMQPMYNLARLESDRPRRERILTMLRERMWSEFKNAKNPFFAFIYSGTNPDYADPAISRDALSQLSGFPPAPRVKWAVDLRNDPKYSSREPECGDQPSHDTAIDVADRRPEDFLWQRHPWDLVEPGDESQTYPGIDYLVAYWLGRHHELIEDDTEHSCTVWRDR